jgi:hypothetical protein
LRSDHHLGTAFDDAGFFGGDLAQRISQDSGMVPANGRDYTNIGVYHVGGVEPAAQPHLYRLKIRLGFFETLETHSSHKFEEANRAKPGMICCR